MVFPLRCEIYPTNTTLSFASGPTASIGFSRTCGARPSFPRLPWSTIKNLSITGTLSTWLFSRGIHSRTIAQVGWRLLATSHDIVSSLLVPVRVPDRFPRFAYKTHSLMLSFVMVGFFETDIPAPNPFTAFRHQELRWPDPECLAHNRRCHLEVDGCGQRVGRTCPHPTGVHAHILLDVFIANAKQQLLI
jgi:hypothetical protein